jgi:HEAT repeat protein
VRQSAAYALGQLQAKEAVPELIALLKDETYGLRKSAPYALGQYESNILVSGLFLGLSYNDIFVKKMTMPTGKMTPPLLLMQRTSFKRI